jgi:hypothetical protein
VAIRSVTNSRRRDGTSKGVDQDICGAHSQTFYTLIDFVRPEPLVIFSLFYLQEAPHVAQSVVCISVRRVHLRIVGSHGALGAGR